MNQIGSQIVVCDGSFVYIGNCEVDEKWLFIHGARNIRRWGTKAGLGELRNGPTKETISDLSGEVLVPLNRVNHFIKVVKGW